MTVAEWETEQSSELATIFSNNTNLGYPFIMGKGKQMNTTTISFVSLISEFQPRFSNGVRYIKAGRVFLPAFLTLALSLCYICLLLLSEATQRTITATEWALDTLLTRNLDIPPSIEFDELVEDPWLVAVEAKMMDAMLPIYNIAQNLLLLCPSKPTLEERVESDLQSMTIRQLKELACQHRVKGYGKMTKTVLVESLLQK
jgi:hypothetical protein